MFCEVCGKKEATVHYTEVIDDELMEMHLCEGCAKKKGESVKAPFSLSDLLAGLADLKVPEGIDAKQKCPVCGLTYSDFKKLGRLGCGACYENFKSSLTPLIKKIHGSTKHVGKTLTRVAGTDKTERKLNQLRRELDKAIQQEEFEKAADLRDEIKKTEKKTK